MADEKLIRKQIRNVLAEQGGSEAIKEAVGQCNLLITQKMVDLEKQCLQKIAEMHDRMVEDLGKMDKRAKTIQGFLVSQVKNDIETKIHRQEDVIDAIVDTLAQYINLEDFAQKVKVRADQVGKDKAEKASQALQEKLKAQQSKPAESSVESTEEPVSESKQEQAV